MAGLFVYCDTRKVAGALIQAGQCIEKRGLSAVGISNQSNMDRFFYHSEVRKGSLCRIAVVYEIGSFLLRLRKIAG